MEGHYLLQVVIVVFVRRLYIFHLYFTALLHVADRWKSHCFVRQFPGVLMNNHCRFLWSISIGKLFNISMGTFPFMEEKCCWLMFIKEISVHKPLRKIHGGVHFQLHWKGPSLCCLHIIVVTNDDFQMWQCHHHRGVHITVHINDDVLVAHVRHRAVQCNHRHACMNISVFNTS